MSVLESNKGRKDLTYFRYCGITYLCDNVGPWSGPPQDEYLFDCPECGCFHCTRGTWKASNNSGRLTLDPPDVVCSHCGLHLQIEDGEAKVIFHDE